MLKRNDRIKEIRILPMNKESEFKGRIIEEVQQSLFRDDLPNRKNCAFRYRKYGLKAEKGALILFQYDNHIIAVAKFDGRENFPTPDKKGYGGELYLKCNSIAIFEPITSDEIKKIWTGFKGFSHVKYRLSSNKYPLLWDLLRRKKIKYAHELW